MNVAEHSHLSNAKDSSPKNSLNPFFGSTFFQPKLSINTPGDSFEQEADAMADKVMRMKIPQKTDTFFKPALSTIQRKNHSTDELEDEKLHRKEMPGIQRKYAACAEKDRHVHRKENSGSETQGSNELDNYVSSLSSSGHSLPESSLQFFEPRFGQDFSNVKVHTDSVAAKSAQSINALAYTTGNNIVFNQGQYSPNSESGQRLMAHELTHVVQQGGGVQRKKIQRLPQCETKNPDGSVTKFNPIAEISKKVGTSDCRIGINSSDFDRINSGPGKIEFGNCGVGGSSNTQGKLRFMADSIGWQLTAKLDYCCDPDRATLPNLLFGFIQTVESATYSASYGKDKFTKRTSAGRDALSFLDPATGQEKYPPGPWYDQKSGNFGPRDWGTSPTFVDTPNVFFPITHPNDSSAFINSVCMKGKFNIWLIVYDKQSTIDYIHNWSVNMDFKFVRQDPQSHPCNTGAWMKLGTGVNLINKGQGKGSQSPVLNTPIAGQSTVTNNSATAGSCD